MFKKVLFMGLFTVLLVSYSVPAYAASATMERLEASSCEETKGIMWSDTMLCKCYISSSGNTITSTLIVTANNTNTSISGTMYLEKYEGGTWKNVNSWNVSGLGQVTMSPTYNGVSGKKYRARISLTVGSDQINSTSNEITL